MSKLLIHTSLYFMSIFALVLLMGGTGVIIAFIVTMLLFIFIPGKK